jgi:iron(III) transport system permease protein
MHERRPLRWTTVLMIAAALFGLLVVFGLFFLPLFNVVVMSVTSSGGFSLKLFGQLLVDAKMKKVIGDTLYINILSSFFASLIGVVMAYLMAYTDIRLKKAVHLMLLLPLVIPGYILTLAWMQFFAKNGGVALFLRQFIPTLQMPNIFSYWGIIFVFAVTKYPIIYILTLSTFRKISVDMELAASISGCGRLGTFIKIILPMSLSGIANGALLVFISCLDNFGTVAFLGIPARITVLSTDIYQSVVSFSGNNFGIAAAKSVILGGIGVLASVILWRVAKMFQTMQTEVEDMSPRIFLGRKKILLELLSWILIVGINLVPLVTMVLTAFVKGLGVGYSLSNMSLANFTQILGNAKSMNAIKNSVILGIGTCLICVVLGTVVAYLMVRKPGKTIRIVDSIISVPYSIPGIILGLGLIITWASPLPLINKTIYNTVFMLLVSYVVRFTSLQIRSSSTAILQLDVSMEEAASASGAGGLKKWMQIIIPLIFPATASGMGLVFISALTELTTSALLWSAGSEVIGVVVYNYTSAGYTTTACAMSTIVLLALIVLLLVYKGAGLIVKNVEGRA